MPTRREIRRAIGKFRWRGRKLMELFGTATAATTTTVDLGELNPYPTDTNHFDMYGVSCVGGTGVDIERVATVFTQSSNRITFAPSYTTFSTDSIIELWQQGFSATDINDAINDAIDTIGEDHLEEWHSTVLATEDGRVEYPLPTTPRFLYAVQLFNQDPLLGVSLSNLNTFRALSNVSGAQQLAQTFAVTSDDTLVRGVLVYLRIVGTISTARTITAAIQTTSGSPVVPSGTEVTGATGTLSTADILQPGFFFIDFGRPVELDEATYALVLSTTGGVDATNHTAWGEDTDNVYSGGNLLTYNGSAWSAVTGSDMLFHIIPWGQDWTDLAGHEFDVRTETTNAFVTLVGDEGKPLPTDFGSGYAITEGRPIRLLGYSTSDRPTDDTTNIDAPRAYIESKALSLVLRSAVAGTGDAAALEWIKYFDAVAERERQIYPVRTLLHPNARRIRTAGN